MNELQRFRQQAERELGDRRGAERRYSASLRAAGVAYWRAREAAGEGLAAVSTALGVAPETLRRWTRDAGLRPVHVIRDAVPDRQVVVMITRDGVRVDGLDVAGIAELVASLR